METWRDGGLPQEETVGTLCDSIETSLWMAAAYRRQGARGLAAECLRSAWSEYLRFSDVLSVYAGAELGTRLVRALGEAGNPLADLLHDPACWPDALAVAAA